MPRKQHHVTSTAADRLDTFRYLGEGGFSDMKPGRRTWTVRQIEKEITKSRQGKTPTWFDETPESNG